MQDSLPPVLYIKMDNTCSDNKNKYTRIFLALLVELGFFRKVNSGAIVLLFIGMYYTLLQVTLLLFSTSFAPSVVAEVTTTRNLVVYL